MMKQRTPVTPPPLMLQLEYRGATVTHQGVSCLMMEGHTAGGVPLKVYVKSMHCTDPKQQRQYEQEILSL